MKPYVNFEKTYVKDCFGNMELMWKHKDGAVSTIDFDWMENYVHMQIQCPNERSFICSIKFVDGVMKIYLDDDYIERDLKTHPSYDTGRIASRELLVKVYLNSVLRSRTAEQIRSAILDVVMNNFKIG